ncbi:tail fiber family protein [Vibrio phage KIT04]|nr:tail fiber family protein [Vibrio phage KIT04]
MRVDNLQAETTITEQGERVYSPNNKPSASDIGALPAGGKAANSARADTVTNTNLGTTATSYYNITSTSWYGDAPIGKSQMVRGTSVGLPIAEPGFLYKLGARDVLKGHGWMFITDYAGKASRVFFGAQEDGSKAPIWTEVYSPNHKPTAADVGAHPNSWRPTWNDVSSKPAQATRWPKWGEISDRPGTMPPSSHTHPWSQITGIPSYATRWPNWGEISGKPGNLLTQTTADTRYLGKNAKATDSDKLDGLDSSAFQRVVTVSGSVKSGKWYTVASGSSRCAAEFIIGDPQSGRHGYTRFFAGISYGNGPILNVLGSTGFSSGKGVLRHIRIVDKSSDRTYGAKEVQVYVDGDSTISVYMNDDYSPFNGWGLVKPKEASGTNIQRVTLDLDKTNGFMSTDHMYVGSNRVYHQGYKPTAADVGAMTQSQGDGRYVRFDYSGNTSYPRLVPAKGDWLRSPAAGFLPDSNGGASLGTSSWRWSQIWGNAIYDSGHRVFHDGRRPTAAQVGAEPTLAGDRKRKISYGTGNPSGGSDGDVYIQYK